MLLASHVLSTKVTTLAIRVDGRSEHSLLHKGALEVGLCFRTLWLHRDAESNGGNMLSLILDHGRIMREAEITTTQESFHFDDYIKYVRHASM